MMTPEEREEMKALIKEAIREEREETLQAKNRQAIMEEFRRSAGFLAVLRDGQ